MFQFWVQRHCPRPSEPHEHPALVEMIYSVTPCMSVSNPRDNIYAMLGLNDHPDIQIEPNYEHSVREVCVTTAKAIIQGTKCLDILIHV